MGDPMSIVDETLSTATYQLIVFLLFHSVFILAKGYAGQIHIVVGVLIGKPLLNTTHLN